jgi:diguanylate cyclase (GGDEF)-like protein
MREAYKTSLASRSTTKIAHMDDDKVLHADEYVLSARFRLLVESAPKLYLTVIVTVCFVVLLIGDDVPTGVLAPWAMVLIGASIIRGYHWWRLGKNGYDFCADEMRRRLIETEHLGVILLTFFASVGYLVLQSSDLLLRTTTMVVIWAASVGTAIYLFVLPQTARRIVLGVTVTMCCVFLWSGGRALLIAIPMFLTLSVALIHFLHRSFETFKATVEAQALVERMRKDAVRLAMTDALTGLPNRRAFDERLAMLATDSKPFAVAILDLDSFKPVNDTYGHGVGDKALVSVAQRLRSLGDMVFVARMGGDEFALLIEDVELAEAVPSRAVGLLSAAHRIDDHTIYLGASCGVAYWRRPGDEVHVAEHADAALYGAKQRPNRQKDGGGRITVWQAAA